MLVVIAKIAPRKKLGMWIFLLAGAFMKMELCSFVVSKLRHGVQIFPNQYSAMVDGSG
jgi:hypothetical protein